MNPEKVQNIICIILYWYNFHWGFKKLLKVAAGKWNPGVSRTQYTAFAMHHRAEGRHRCRRHMAAMEMRLEGLFSLSLLWCPVVAHFCLSRTPEGCRGCSPRIPLLHCGSKRAKKKTCMCFLSHMFDSHRTTFLGVQNSFKEQRAEFLQRSLLTPHRAFIVFDFILCSLTAAVGWGWKNCPQFLYCNPYKTDTALNQYLAIWHNYHGLISSPAGLI